MYKSLFCDTQLKYGEKSRELLLFAQRKEKVEREINCVNV